MSEPKSKCCGAEVRYIRAFIDYDEKEQLFNWWIFCSKCKQPCELESKEGGETTDE